MKKLAAIAMSCVFVVCLATAGFSQEGATGSMGGAASGDHDNMTSRGDKGVRTVDPHGPSMKEKFDRGSRDN